MFIVCFNRGVLADDMHWARIFVCPCCPLQADKFKMIEHKTRILPIRLSGAGSWVTVFELVILFSIFVNMQVRLHELGGWWVGGVMNSCVSSHVNVGGCHPARVTRT